MIVRTTACLCVMAIALPLVAQTTQPPELVPSTEPAPAARLAGPAC